jgi:hypothetical protein
LFSFPFLQSITIFKKIVERMLAERRSKAEERKVLANKMAMAKKRALQKKRDEAKKLAMEEEVCICDRLVLVFLALIPILLSLLQILDQLEMRDLKARMAEKLSDKKGGKRNTPPNKQDLFMVI